jgi:hypothetical protein
MSDFTVISDVSETLKDVLDESLSVLNPPAVAEIHDLQGVISTSPARITIFLYDACEDPSARNRPHVRLSSPPDVIIKKPPVALLLRYMLTPWGGDRDTEQTILGRVMQTLYDGAILSGPQLRGSLAGTTEAIKITHAPISLEDRTRVWNSVQKPYHLSVTYEIRVVRIDVEAQQRIVPVASRTAAASTGGGGP